MDARNPSKASIGIVGVVIVLVAAVCAWWFANTSYARGAEAGFTRGYEAGQRTARDDFARMVCQLPGEVDASCATFGLPVCEFEDGTPAGCLWENDGRFWWTINS